MTDKPVRFPSAEYPISVDPTQARVVVTAGGQVVADSRDALTLRESDHADILYIPRKDVRMDLLQRTDHQSYCPYKGDAAYYSIPAGGDRSVNAIWTYEAPFEAVAGIKDHLAFYPERVDGISVQTD